MSITGDEPRYFGRPVFTRWVVPVDNENTRVIAWANFGPRSDLPNPEWMTPEAIEIIEGAEPRTRSRYEAIRKPGDYEAFVSMGKITQHKKENLATSDKGVAMFRRRLQKDIRAVVAGQEPRIPEPTETPRPTYAGDTVLYIPPVEGLDDEQRIRTISRQVVKQILAADNYPSRERDHRLQTELRATERKARKTD